MKGTPLKEKREIRLTKENTQSGANGQAGGNGAESQAAVGKETSEKSAKESGGDAISLLKQDHREVEQLFERYESAKRRADRAKIVAQVCNALTLEAILEEEIFYPACRKRRPKEGRDRGVPKGS
jgi:hemerythrin superfamily protein